MAKQKVIRFGAIGPGGAGRARVLRLAQTTPEVQVVAAADPSEQNLKNLEDGLGKKIAWFTSPKGYQEMIEQMELDAVGIFSPHALHFEHAKFALEAGMNVLIEKPMVCGVGNALETAHIAEKKGLVYIIHYQRHFQPKYFKMREAIRKGAIGKVKNFYVFMAQDWSGASWRGDPKFSGGGQINDSGSHYQDILLWMTGALPVSAEGTIDYYYHGEEKKVEMNGSFNLVLSNGASGRMILLADYIHGFMEDIRIIGDKGTLLFQNEKLLLFKHGEKAPVEMDLATMPKNYPSCPCDNFGRLLTGRTKVNHVPPIFGARVALLTEAMLQSGKTGKRVECETILKKAGYSVKDLEKV